jgi:hypothetical protein
MENAPDTIKNPVKSAGPWLREGTEVARPLKRQRDQARVIEAPPSTNEAVPVTKAESSDAR